MDILSFGGNKFRIKERRIINFLVAIWAEMKREMRAPFIPKPFLCSVDICFLSN
jgi:hypothetical protein